MLGPRIITQLNNLLYFRSYRQNLRSCVSVFYVPMVLLTGTMLEVHSKGPVCLKSVMVSIVACIGVFYIGMKNLFLGSSVHAL